MIVQSGFQNNSCHGISFRNSSSEGQLGSPSGCLWTQKHSLLHCLVVHLPLEVVLLRRLISAWMLQVRVPLVLLNSHWVCTYTLCNVLFLCNFNPTFHSPYLKKGFMVWQAQNHLVFGPRSSSTSVKVKSTLHHVSLVNCPGVPGTWKMLCKWSQQLSLKLEVLSFLLL